jgi:hypothetical protein
MIASRIKKVPVIRPTPVPERGVVIMNRDQATALGIDINQFKQGKQYVA